ncbi:unnamed protein product, partial [Rotaria socialis]
MLEIFYRLLRLSETQPTDEQKLLRTAIMEIFGHLFKDKNATYPKNVAEYNVRDKILEALI